MNNSIKYALIFAAALVLSQTAGALAPAPMGSTVDKIDLTSGLNTWEALDEKHLVLSLGSKQNYLVTLTRSCHALPFATHLGVSASNNTIYAGFDYITADGERCAINTINVLSKKQRSELTRL